jgi:addiction module HigA family antidote
LKPEHTIAHTNKIVKSKRTIRKAAQNIHPGEILRQEFLKPMNLSVYRLAREIRVPVPRLNDIVLEKRGISADTAVRLARFFGTTESFWMNLQASYDVRKTKAALMKELAKIKPRGESVA